MSSFHVKVLCEGPSFFHAKIPHSYVWKSGTETVWTHMINRLECCVLAIAQLRRSYVCISTYMYTTGMSTAVHMTRIFAREQYPLLSIALIWCLSKLSSPCSNSAVPVLHAGCIDIAGYHKGLFLVNSCNSGTIAIGLLSNPKVWRAWRMLSITHSLLSGCSSLVKNNGPCFIPLTAK